MSAKVIAARLTNLPEASPFARHLRNRVCALLKKFTRAANSQDRALSVEDRIAIGPKKSLILVRCHGRRFLVASAGDTLGPFIEIASSKPRRTPRRESEA
jgi:flagellar biogenesis protein FliO